MTEPKEPFTLSATEFVADAHIPMIWAEQVFPGNGIDLHFYLDDPSGKRPLYIQDFTVRDSPLFEGTPSIPTIRLAQDKALRFIQSLRRTEYIEPVANGSESDALRAHIASLTAEVEFLRGLVKGRS